MNGWLRSLNKHLDQLRRYNIQKGSPGSNFDREALIDALVITLFEPADIQQLNKEWSNKGFPLVYVSEIDEKKLAQLAEKYVDLILKSEGRFTVNESELS